MFRSLHYRETFLGLITKLKKTSPCCCTRKALFCNARCALLQCTLLQCTLRDSAMHVALFCNARCASNAAYDSSILSAMTLVDACSLFCANYMYRVGHNRIPYMTIYDRIFGDVPAKKHSMYNVYIWFWPTLDMCILKS